MTWILRWALTWLMAAACVSVLAENTASPAPAEVPLTVLREQLDKLPSSADSDAALKAVTAQIDAIAAQADKFASARTGQLADLNARLGELGPAPTGSSTEAPDITRQRTALLKERNALDSDIRLARLLSINAQQRRDDLIAQRRAAFEATLFQRSDSPLGVAFWENASVQWVTDRIQLSAIAAEVHAGLASAFDAQHRFATLGGLASAVLLLILGNWLTERVLIWLVMRMLPIGRLRRSLLALLTTLAHVLVVGLAAGLAWQTLETIGLWETRSSRLAEAMVRMVMFMAFVVGLGRALLANQNPSWRLPPLSDPLALRMRSFPWLLAVASVVAGLPSILNDVTGSEFNSVLSHLVPTLVLIGASLLMLHRLRTRTPAPENSDHPQWLGLFMGVVLATLIVAAVLMLCGYLALARTVAGQLVWTGIVSMAAYLLFKCADDLCMALISSRGPLGQRLQNTLGLAPQVLDRVAVILSGLSRVAVFFYMLMALTAPLGSAPNRLMQRSVELGAGLKVGEFQLVPRAILGAILVLVLGFLALRVLKRWLENSYLPQTTLEPGMRSSLTTLLGYMGGVLVIAFALSALGIGINRIAWVASALSVGIGFGLQAIVQNFISGLILLAERPVKAGDWVVLGTAEGDVRRINVRATEIQLADRSTLIVPNSELITKTVRNMTLANPEGRVLIRLPMPMTTDTQRVHDVMLKACREHPSVLPTPAPVVTLDGVENTLLIFQATAFVSSPRVAGSVRSDLLFTILQQLQAAQVPMASYVPPPIPSVTPPPTTS